MAETKTAAAPGTPEIGWALAKGCLSWALHDPHRLNVSLVCLHPNRYDNAALSAAWDGFGREFSDRLLARPEYQAYRRLCPKVGEAKKALAELRRCQGRCILDRQSAIDQLTGEALATKLAEIGVAEQDYQRRADTVAAGLKTIEADVLAARGGLLAAAQAVQSEAVAHRKQRLLSRRPDLENGVTDIDRLGLAALLMRASILLNTDANSWYYGTQGLPEDIQAELVQAEQAIAADRERSAQQQRDAQEQRDRAGQQMAGHHFMRSQ
jgi:cation transport regulator ChaB